MWDDHRGEDTLHFTPFESGLSPSLHDAIMMSAAKAIVAPQKGHPRSHRHAPPGEPNVGKSSTMNMLLGAHKVREAGREGASAD